MVGRPPSLVFFDFIPSYDIFELPDNINASSFFVSALQKKSKTKIKICSENPSILISVAAGLDIDTNFLSSHQQQRLRPINEMP